MSDAHVQYLIAGGGIAAAAAAAAIREIDSDGSMMIVGQEINRPYHRHHLKGDYLLGKLGHDSLFIHSESWYKQQNIELRTGRAAAHLDTSRQVLTLDDGSNISFDSLLIATGASQRRLVVPGSELPSVYYPQNIEDADRLRHAIVQARREGKGRACVIGGTLNAIQLATTLRQLNLHVDLVCGEAHLGSEFAGESAGSAIERILTAQGVQVVLNAHPLRLEGDGRVQRVVLDNGQTLATDLVALAMGVLANKLVLRTTPIRAENAILTNEHCQTNVPDIYAAGECAAIFDPRFGKHRHLLHETNASALGKLAGRNMAGLKEPISAMNYVERRIFDTPVFAAGENRLVQRRIIRAAGNEDQKSLLEFGLAADGRLAHILGIGYSGNRQILLEMISHRLELAGREDEMKDPSFDLTALSN